MIKHSPKNRPPMTDELREKGKKRNKRLRRELNLFKGTKLYDDLKKLREGNEPHSVKNSLKPSDFLLDKHVFNVRRRSD